MKVMLMTVIGLIAAPLLWALQKSGVVRPRPKLPAIFEALQAHLFRNGISFVADVPKLSLNDVTAVASFQPAFDPEKFRVVMVTRSASEALAALVENEVRRAPQFSGVRRNGTLVMACTFSPEDTALEEAFCAAFMSFNPGSTVYST